MVAALDDHARPFSPEAVGIVDWPPRLYQGSVTYVATNRLLFEVGYNYGASPDTIFPRDGEITGGQGVYRVVETGGTYQGQAVAPITYGPFGLSIYDVPQHQNSMRASMSYVTGSHQLKVGTDFQTGVRGRVNTNFADDIQLRTTGFVLNQVTIYAPSGAYQTNLDLNGGIYVQDRWTRNRMTLSGALRYDVQKESYRPVHGGPDQVPAQPEPVVSWREGRQLEGNQPARGRLRTISSATARRRSRPVSRGASRRNRSRRPTR